MSLAERVASRHVKAYFDVGDKILFGKYKNALGTILGFSKDERGIPVVTIETSSGKKKTLKLYTIWKAEVKYPHL